MINKLETLVIFGLIRKESNEHSIACRKDAEGFQRSTELSQRTVLERQTIVDFNVVVANPHCKKSKERKSFVILDLPVQRTIQLIQDKFFFYC